MGACGYVNVITLIFVPISKVITSSVIISPLSLSLPPSFTPSIYPIFPSFSPLFFTLFPLASDSTLFLTIHLYFVDAEQEILILSLGNGQTTQQLAAPLFLVLGLGVDLAVVCTSIFSFILTPLTQNGTHFSWMKGSMRGDPYFGYWCGSGCGVLPSLYIIFHPWSNNQNEPHSFSWMEGRVWGGEGGGMRGGGRKRYILKNLKIIIGGCYKLTPTGYSPTGGNGCVSCSIQPPFLSPPPLPFFCHLSSISLSLSFFIFWMLGGETWRTTKNLIYSLIS